MPNVALTHCMYDSLLTWSNDYALENLMAEEVTVNSDASVWTVRIKDGVEFHNGKTVTADDVIWSYKRIIDPKDPRRAPRTSRSSRRAACARWTSARWSSL